MSKLGALRSFGAPLFHHPEYFRFIKMPSTPKEGRAIERWLTHVHETRKGLMWQCFSLHGNGYLLYVPGGSGPEARYSAMVGDAAEEILLCHERYNALTVSRLSKIGKKWQGRVYKLALRDIQTVQARVNRT